MCVVLKTFISKLVFTIQVLHCLRCVCHTVCLYVKMSESGLFSRGFHDIASTLRHRIHLFLKRTTLEMSKENNDL